MPEIKTCEQYVLRELENEQKKNEQLEEQLEAVKQESSDKDTLIAALQAELQAIGSALGKNGEIKDGYVSVYVWGNKTSDYMVLSKIIEENQKKSEE